jgi:hypothetical protein
MEAFPAITLVHLPGTFLTMILQHLPLPLLALS